MNFRNISAWSIRNPVIPLVLFTALVFLHAIAFFYRSYLEWKEGPESEGKYLDRDVLGDEDAELVHAIEEHH